MDSLTITREEFRLEMHKLLEFLAQGLGGVPGTFTNENVDPLALLLAGAPKLLATAIPPAKDTSQRLPSTSWVQKEIAAYAKGRSFYRTKNYSTAVGGSNVAFSVVQFEAPGVAGGASSDLLQLVVGGCGPADASGNLAWTLPVPFVGTPVVLGSTGVSTGMILTQLFSATSLSPTKLGCTAQMRYQSGAITGPLQLATFNFFAYGAFDEANRLP